MNLRILTYNIHGLPWSKNNSASIVLYISHILPDVLCLQEVFTKTLCDFYVDQLSRLGYTVVVPRDSGVSVLGSGLLTAVLSSRFRVLSHCFYPYMSYYTIEIGANKGFHTLRLEDGEGRRILVVNTHTQSSTEFSGSDGAAIARKAQFTELVHWLEHDPNPVILAGDMNCEYSPHPSVRFIRPEGLRKCTFPQTGEDLDHLAWIPTQWAPVGTHWCHFDKAGIRVAAYKVDPVKWSDHFPVLAEVLVPASLFGSSSVKLPSVVKLLAPVQGPCE